MIVETNHIPKMMERLRERQEKVDAGGESHRFFFLRVSAPTFGVRALQRLVASGRVELKPVGNGNALVRLTD